jgi:hypothetical protein
VPRTKTTVDPERARLAAEGVAAVGRMLDEWRQVRGELAAIEAAEHPDIVDRFGRAWRWKGGDLYAHCGNAIPEKWIAGSGLAPVALKENHNYYPLCDICTSEWTDEDRKRHQFVREEFLRMYGPDGEAYRKDAS